MSTVLVALRAANLLVIDENPIDFVAHTRSFVMGPDGGRAEQIVTSPPARGRLVVSTRDVRRAVGEAGMSEIAPGLKLITSHAVPLDWGSMIDIEIVVTGARYRVTHVRVCRYRGAPYAIHASLEEVR